MRKVVLIGAVPPLMLKTDDNPDGTAHRRLRHMRAKVLADRSQFFPDLAGPFYGANRTGSEPSKGVIDNFWLMGMQVGLKAAHDCIRQFSETDFNDDLTKIDVPTLVIHGDDDQIVPIAASARLSAQIVQGGELKVYPGTSHGMFATHADLFNADLLDFIKR